MSELAPVWPWGGHAVSLCPGASRKHGGDDNCLPNQFTCWTSEKVNTKVLCKLWSPKQLLVIIIIISTFSLGWMQMKCIISVEIVELVWRKMSRLKHLREKHIYGPKTPGLLIRKKKSFLVKHIYLGTVRQFVFYNSETEYFVKLGKMMFYLHFINWKTPILTLALEVIRSELPLKSILKLQEVLQQVNLMLYWLTSFKVTKN